MPDVCCEQRGLATRTPRIALWRLAIDEFSAVSTGRVHRRSHAQHPGMARESA